ncbi:uncharacterized protein SOCE26_013940 [Sorangium cellulosum]|uniref:DUF4123 domain-containing protein n=1 Tax=Sorangium cellulosum TaxID=56 RepID=A0A2L0EL26_SORCE|nr:DUF4123 domain-containing protein [Sorangium cellulosum]AUX39999.1 uncharacterized protein SOCE26_013940 [Sorangium cellulosum]
MSSTVDEDETVFSSKEELAELLQRHEPLYAVLDAARDPAVLKLVNDSKEQARSLYDGRRGEQLAEVAPYLVRVSAGSTLFERLIWEGWGQSWGVFIACDAPFNELRRHLRRFLMVQTEGRQALYFRCYDPRVLRVFLDTATIEEQRALFGPISAFLLEGRCDMTVLRRARVGAAMPRPEAPWELLTLREAQMKVFSSELVESFIDRMATTLRFILPARDVRGVIRDEIERACRYGVVSEAEVKRYLLLTAVLGPCFDERMPWASAILRQDTDERRKLRRLERQLRLVDRRSCRRRDKRNPASP